MWLWCGLAALLAGGAVGFAAAGASNVRWDWQPALWPAQPWRAWTAVWVHFSARHLGANVAGALLVGLLGWAARVPARCTLAWVIAWPLTQIGLSGSPGLLHFGGLSGVLHAGAAVAGVHLVLAERGRARTIGALLLAGLLTKILLERPWGPPVRWPAEWDIGIAPLAHFTGAVAGASCAAVLHAAAAWRRHRQPGARRD